MAEIDPVQVFAECNERLDVMVNNLVTIATKQGALQLGASDMIKMRATFDAQISPFMVSYLAATAVARLVNDALIDTHVSTLEGRDL